MDNASGLTTSLAPTTKTTSVDLNSSLISSISFTISLLVVEIILKNIKNYYYIITYGTLHSANSTFICLYIMINIKMNKYIIKYRFLTLAIFQQQDEYKNGNVFLIF